MADDAKPSTQNLAQAVRAKYPGVYDDLTDTQLDAKVRAKYPGAYDDIPKPSSYAPDQTMRQFGQRAAAKRQDPMFEVMHPVGHTDELGNPVDAQGKPITPAAQAAGKIAALRDDPVADLVTNAALLGSSALSAPGGELSVPSLAKGMRRVIGKATEAVGGDRTLSPANVLAAPGRFMRAGMQEARTPPPVSVDPHMPNVSTAQSWAATLAQNPDGWKVDASALPQVKQAIWKHTGAGYELAPAVEGETLAPGERVNVTTRSGGQKMMTVPEAGKLATDPAAATAHDMPGGITAAEADKIQELLHGPNARSIADALLGRK